MKRLSKRCKEFQKFADDNKLYGLPEAVSVLKNVPHVKFDETVDVDVNVGIDPSKGEQVVRGSLVLPHGRGKKVKVFGETFGSSQVGWLMDVGKVEVQN